MTSYPRLETRPRFISLSVGGIKESGRQEVGCLLWQLDDIRILIGEDLDSQEGYPIPLCAHKFVTSYDS